MPWTTNDSRIRSLPKEGRSLWVRVANGYLDDHPGEDVSAIRIAWSAVERAGYKKSEGQHKWTLDGTPESVAALEKSIHPFGGVIVGFAKAYTRQGKRIVTIKASGLKVDRQNERMMPSAIEDMVNSCKEGKVDLLDNHFSSFEMGKSVGASIVEEDDPENGLEKGDMLVDFELNKTHPNNDQLFQEASKGTCTRQASVGGNVTDSKFEYDKELGCAVKQLHHVDLDHVAVTREGHSAYPSAAFTAAIAKHVHLASGKAQNQGGDRMEKLKALIEELKKSAAIAVEIQKGAFTVTPEMLDDNMMVKAEFKDQILKAKLTPSKDDMKEISSALSVVLKALGVPSVPKTDMTKAYGTIKEAMDRHKEAYAAHKEAYAAHQAAADGIAGIKEAMGDGEEGIPKDHPVHKAIKEAMDAHKEAMDLHKKAMDIHKDAMEAHKAVAKSMPDAGLPEEGSDSVPDSGTGKDGKEEKRDKKTAPELKDGAVAEELADGPGSKGPHEGNGSVEQMKAVAQGLVKKLEADFTAKLQKATTELEEMKKDAQANKSELTKKMLEVGELKKDLAKLQAQPAAPRPGAGQKVEKTVNEIVDGRAVVAITKAMTEDGNDFQAILQADVENLASLRNTKAWTPEMEKEARKKAEMLKACITMGAVAAQEMYKAEADKMLKKA